MKGQSRKAIILWALAVCTAAALCVTWLRAPDRVSLQIGKDFERPVVFYGKLVDQFGSPVAGAEIIVSIHSAKDFSARVEKIHRMSDSAGLFEIRGGRGLRLSIIPRKAGYRPVSGGNIPISPLEGQVEPPDKLNPKVITMRKLKGGEPLIHFSYKGFLPRDGTPVRFDLVAGKRVDDGGDLILAIETPTKPPAGAKYNWKVNLQAVEGGIVLSRSSFEIMFEAPASGYEPRQVFGCEADQTAWANSLTENLYLRSRGGACFGKLVWMVSSLLIRDDRVFTSLEAYMNPGGSQNLEVQRDRVTYVTLYE